MLLCLIVCIWVIFLILSKTSTLGTLFKFKQVEHEPQLE